jgi:hypothetical protein
VQVMGMMVHGWNRRDEGRDVVVDAGMRPGDIDLDGGVRRKICGHQPAHLCARLAVVVSRVGERRAYLFFPALAELCCLSGLRESGVEELLLFSHDLDERRGGLGGVSDGAVI